jgi:hypothetical protein
MVHLRPLLIVMLLLTGSLAPADEKPVTLDELVKEYERFELPFPPVGSKFVIYEWGYDEDEWSSGGPVRIKRGYAILASSKTRSDPFASVYRGVNPDGLPMEFRIRVVPPEPVSLRQFKSAGFKDIITAVQCEKLGYHALAKHLFENYVRQWKQPKEDEWHLTAPMDALREEIYDYWKEQISNPKVDRRKIIKFLTEYDLATAKPGQKTPENSFIKSLELSLEPRKSKPGSLESLIDELGDATGDPVDVKLIEHGFEIVPTLIAHLDDRRMTRMKYGYNSFLTVGQACGLILDRFMGERIDRIDLTAKEREERKNALPGIGMPIFFNNEESLRPLNRDAVKEWWNDARAGSEKDYLLEKLFSNYRAGITTHTLGHNAVILKVLAARFPDELKGVYVKALDSKDDLGLPHIIDVILNSKLDAKSKREMIDLGIVHNNPKHRMRALGALSELDNEEYSRRLLQMLERIPEREFVDMLFDTETHLVLWCNSSRNPAVWPTLEKAIKRMGTRDRFEMLNDLNLLTVEGERLRRERIRILAAFLDDPAIRSESEKENRFGNFSVRHAFRDYELRNFAATQLAPYFLEWIDYDEHRSADEWACLRKWLKDEVAKELK